MEHMGSFMADLSRHRTKIDEKKDQNSWKQLVFYVFLAEKPVKKLFFVAAAKP